MYNPEELRDEHGKWTITGSIHKLLHSLGGMKGEEARRAIVKGHALDTSRIHGDGTGHYHSPAREALHKQIVEHFLSEGRSRPKGTKPDAIFTAGGPASGKSGLAGRADESARNLPTPNGHVYINPDAIKEHLPEYQRLKAMGRSRRDIAATAVHEESSHIAKVLTAAALERNMPIVVDGVGDSEKGKFAGKLRTAQKRGYNVTTRYAHLPFETAKAREVKRAAHSGRKVEEGYMKSAHRQVAARFNAEIKQMRGIRSEVYSTAGEGSPKLIAVRDPTRGRGVHVVDRRAYNEHVGKSKLR